MTKQKTKTATSMGKLANCYGVSRRTMSNYVYKNETLMEKLADANWSRGKILFPKHWAIIIEELGPFDDDFE